MYFFFAYSMWCLCSQHLLAAWTSNSDRGLFPQPPVYALLTDLTNFIIFKYDGNIFTRQGITIHTTFPDGTRYRYEFLSNMMPGEITTLKTSPFSSYLYSHFLMQWLNDFSPLFFMVSLNTSMRFGINPRGAAM